VVCSACWAAAAAAEWPSRRLNQKLPRRSFCDPVQRLFDCACTMKLIMRFGPCLARVGSMLCDGTWMPSNAAGDDNCKPKPQTTTHLGERKLLRLHTATNTATPLPLSPPRPSTLRRPQKPITGSLPPSLTAQMGGGANDAPPAPIACNSSSAYSGCPAGTHNSSKPLLAEAIAAAAALDHASFSSSFSLVPALLRPPPTPSCHPRLSSPSRPMQACSSSSSCSCSSSSCR
jgi:hypothetical protein